MNLKKYSFFMLMAGGALVNCATPSQSTQTYIAEPSSVVSTEWTGSDGVSGVTDDITSGLRVADRASSSNNTDRSSTPDSDTKKAEKKIIFSASLSLTAENPDTAIHQIENIAETYDGYMLETGTYSVTIRVKSNALDDALDDIAELGRVQYKNITGQDVTETYADDAIRLENAEKSRERYLELLAKAENVEAALQVERELERLNGLMSVLKGRLNRLDHLSEYSTITVRVKEKREPGLLGYVVIGLYRSVRWLFVRN